MTEQQRENLEMALVMWTAVDPKTVDYGLNDWKCGTHACFGGHLAMWQYFIDQGVRAAKKNMNYPHEYIHKHEPTMAVDGLICGGYSTSEELFGENLFDPRRFGNRDDEIFAELSRSISDHELVLRRLELALFGDLEQRP